MEKDIKHSMNPSGEGWRGVEQSLKRDWSFNKVETEKMQWFAKASKIAMNMASFPDIWRALVDDQQTWKILSMD